MEQSKIYRAVYLCTKGYSLKQIGDELGYRQDHISRTLTQYIKHKQEERKTKKTVSHTLTQQDRQMVLLNPEIKAKTLAESNEDFAHDRQRIFQLMYKQKQIPLT